MEVALDAATGQMTLWLNGLSCGSVVISGSWNPVQSLLMGAVYRDTTTSGEVFIDEWVIADQYIGPVVVEPESEHAGDPSRWLVIYNTVDADSVAWAAWYRQQRGVPYANLLGLNLPTDETISEAAFIAMRDAVRDYLDRNGLSERILGILCGHGVPGQYLASYALYESVAEHLHRLDGSAHLWANPLFDFNQPTRLTAANADGWRLTSRIDGPTLADSMAMTNRAKSIETGGLGDGADATLWLDAVTVGFNDAITQQAMLDWAASTARQALRLPVELTQPTEPATDVSFESIDHDGFFIGWRQATVPAGFFGEPAGRRVFAMQMDPDLATAPSLRSGTCWVTAAIDSGYAVTAGSSRPYSPSAVPAVAPFFEALRQGWTIGEAWFASLDLLGAGPMLVGDPLMTVRFPQAGWNVYGPFTDWNSARFDTPALLLREDELDVALSGSLESPDDRVALYVVRHVDGHGREETGLRHVRVMRNGTRLQVPPQAMSWPLGLDWRPARVGDQWRFDVSWPTTIAQASVAAVRLMQQVEGGEAELVQEVVVSSAVGRDRHLTLMQPGADEPARYQLQVVGPDGGATTTGWSAWLRDGQEMVGMVALLAEGV